MKLPPVAPNDSGTFDKTLPEITSRIPTITKEQEIPAYQNQTASFTSPYREGEALMPKQKRSLKALWISLVIILVLIIAAYVGFSVYFMSHFTFNTSLNGVDVALQTAEEVDAKLVDELQSYEIKLIGRTDAETISAADIDLRYADDNQVASLLAKQNEWAWPLSFLPQGKTEIEHVKVEYDTQLLETALAALSLANAEQMVAPSDAKLVFENGQYVIAEGEKGTTLDIEKLNIAVGEAIDVGKTQLDLEEAKLYIDPAITADDPTLAEDRDRFNQYVPFRIAYTLGERTEVLDGYTTINWVVHNEDGSFYLDEGAIWAWLASFASNYDTLGATRPVVNGFGQEKTVTGGTYGWQIDQESEYWAIRTAFEQHLGEAREPYLLGSAASLGAQDWGNTYLEVDISEQHMWYVVDGNVVLETAVVTGNPNTGYSTPEGVWSIFMITRNMETKGDPLPEGGYQWGPTVVSYWMQFTSNGCGFHDADWQYNFGGDQYLYTGSHGCINMPPAKAEELYYMLEMDTPVLTHY